MMRISTRGRYALRAMVDVAQHSANEPVPRQEIAARQEISADYVAQLFGQLQAAGLVEGVKGPGGGYRLTRDATAITAGDVVRAVEGPIAVVECVLYGQMRSFRAIVWIAVWPICSGSGLQKPLQEFWIRSRSRIWLTRHSNSSWRRRSRFAGMRHWTGSRRQDIRVSADHQTLLSTCAR